MATEKKEEVVVDAAAELESVKAELEQVKNERDQYKKAYETLSEQHSSVWGLYSNTIDYVVAQTTRKQAQQ